MQIPVSTLADSMNYAVPASRLCTPFPCDSDNRTEGTAAERLRADQARQASEHLNLGIRVLQAVRSPAHPSSILPGPITRNSVKESLF